MIIAGVDVGLNGAITALDQRPLRIANAVEWHLTGLTLKKARPVILQALRTVIPAGSRACVAVEAVGSRTGEGASRANRFGWSRGLIEGVILESGAELVLVPPNIWKRNLGLYNPDKRYARRLAEQMFGRKFKVKETDLAESALIALWLSFKLAGNARVLQ